MENKRIIIQREFRSQKKKGGITDRQPEDDSSYLSLFTSEKIGSNLIATILVEWCYLTFIYVGFLLFCLIDVLGIYRHQRDLFQQLLVVSAFLIGFDIVIICLVCLARSNFSYWFIFYDEQYSNYKYDLNENHPNENDRQRNRSDNHIHSKALWLVHNSYPMIYNQFPGGMFQKLFFGHLKDLAFHILVIFVPCLVFYNRFHDYNVSTIGQYRCTENRFEYLQLPPIPCFLLLPIHVSSLEFVWIAMTILIGFERLHILCEIPRYLMHE